MWIENKIVLLPTVDNKYGSFWINGLGELKLSNPDKICPGTQEYQELYAISNEEIKDGDLVVFDLNSDYLDFKPSIGRYNNNNIFDNNKEKEFEHTKKIICSTDKSLEIAMDISSLDDKNHEIVGCNLPEPPKYFLEMYVKTYNEGKKIEDVSIEYTCSIWGSPDMGLAEYILKVNSGNTINIKTAKDSWNREELEVLIVKAIEWGYYRCENDSSCKPYDWIKQNIN